MCKSAGKGKGGKDGGKGDGKNGKDGGKKGGKGDSKSQPYGKNGEGGKDGGGKGKGADGSKPCYVCGQTGHKSFECPHRWKAPGHVGAISDML